MPDTRQIHELLTQIDRGEILLPEFQRGYVWRKDQVRGLMHSLYKGHPTGHLLIWKTYKPLRVRGSAESRDGHSLLLLDGQQRLTSLYTLFKGKPPPFYEGESLFFDLHFNVQTGGFRFFQKSLMQNNPAWLSVHEFLRRGLGDFLRELPSLEEEQRATLQNNLAALTDLDAIRNYTYAVDHVSGDDYDVDDVVGIFNRVNSAGTPLTKADLAIAHVCSLWPEARGEFRAFSDRMEERGFAFGLDLLTRCLAGVGAGSVALEGSFFQTPAEVHQQAWAQIKPALEHLVGVLRHEALVDSLDDLPTNNVVILMTVYLSRHGGRFPGDDIRRRFIRWMFLAGLWGRYSGATETKLQQDVALVAGGDPDPTHELEAAILRERGRLVLEQGDLDRATVRSAVAYLVRVLARHRGARDWFTGVHVYDAAVGKSAGGERHYVFPRKVLLSAGMKDGRRINAVANRVVLGQRARKELRNVSPADYLPEVNENQPGALAAQSVPLNPELWKPENFLDFLAARRRLLAEAANEFIASWLPSQPDPNGEEYVRGLIRGGESDDLEFKSSLRWDLRQECVNKDLEGVVLKTVAGFLNASGGTLLVGVADDREPIGLDRDYGSLRKPDRDGFENHLQQLFVKAFGEATASNSIVVNFHQIDGHDICQVTVAPSDRPVYVEQKGQSVFWLRVGNATRSLPIPEAVRYIQTRWSGR